MPTKNLFISHIHEDDAHVDGLKGLLARKGYDVRNGSITSDKFNKATSEEYIKQDILAPRIKWAGCLVVLVSAETKTSDFVNWEIEYASNHDTRVVAVFEPGESGVELPEAAKDFADAVVAWNADHIIEAIEGEDHWRQPDGSPRPMQNIERHNC